MSDLKYAERNERKTIVKKKPVNAPSGHEAFLKALEAAGAVVKILKTSGDVKKGTIKTSDKFSISLKETRADGTYQVYVIMKHSVEEFWADPADNASKSE